MKRRTFLKIAGRGGAGGVALAGRLDDLADASDLKAANIQDFFESDDAEVLALAQRVFDKCIMEKLRPPVEPLRHT